MGRQNNLIKLLKKLIKNDYLYTDENYKKLKDEDDTSLDYSQIFEDDE